MSNRFHGLIWRLALLAVLLGCRQSPPATEPVADPKPNAPETQEPAPASAPAAKVRVPADSTVVNVLQLLPAKATAVFIRNHAELRESELTTLLDPSGGFDGLLGGVFSDKEVVLSAMAVLGNSRDRQLSGFAACVQLAPGVTVQRLINAWRLETDTRSFPGIVCYRSPADGDGYFVVQEGDLLVIGLEADLIPRLSADAPLGPIQKRLLPFAKDHALLGGWLSDFHGETLLEPYLPRSLSALQPWEEEVRKLPLGAISSVALGFRLHSPQLTIRVEAADQSLAGEISQGFERSVANTRRDVATLRSELQKGLPPEQFEAIDRFLTNAAEGLRIDRQELNIDIVLPLGQDAAELTGFIGKVQHQGSALEAALAAAQHAVKIGRPDEQLRQIARAMHDYHDLNGQFPRDIEADGKPLLSWRVAILPYLGEEKLHAKFKVDESWDSEHNLALLEQLPRIYRDERLVDPGTTGFLVFAGEGTGFSREQFMFRDVIDGTANTILFVQAPPRLAVPWTKPADIPFDAAEPTRVLNPIPIEGILAAMCDGSTKLVPADFSDEMWRRLILPNDGGIVEFPNR